MRSLQEECGYPIYLNADHTHSLAKAVEAARAGFDAIVFDLSALPFEQNVRQTKEAVETLKTINSAILVEGEIGDIGTGSEIHEEAPDLSRGLTSPAEAKQFVESTGVDILAPAVGNMHGMLKSMVQGQTRKRLDIQRIGQSKSAARVPLTLHGGSGTDDEDLRKAIAAGINIIHINTELRVLRRILRPPFLAKARSWQSRMGWCSDDALHRSPPHRTPCCVTNGRASTVPILCKSILENARARCKAPILIISARGGVP